MGIIGQSVKVCQGIMITCLGRARSKLASMFGNAIIQWHTALYRQTDRQTWCKWSLQDVKKKYVSYVCVWNEMYKRETTALSLGIVLSWGRFVKSFVLVHASQFTGTIGGKEGNSKLDS